MMGFIITTLRRWGLDWYHSIRTLTRQVLRGWNLMIYYEHREALMLNGNCIINLV